jgi:DNA-binding response OmpR family regulator
VSATRKILVVEDESTIAMLLRTMLAQHGYEVVGPYARLNQALAALEGEIVDLALLDVQLGLESVYPLASRLRERQTPLIFLTGHDALEKPDEFAGCPHLTKPFRAAALLAAISDQLAKHRPPRKPRSKPAPVVRG